MFFLHMKNHQTVFSGSSTSPEREAACYIPRNKPPQYAGSGNHHLQKKVAGTSLHSLGRLMLQILGSSSKGQFILKVF